MVKQSADLLERAPVIPVAERILDVLGRANQGRGVEDLSDVVGYGLDDLATAADVSVRQTLFKPFAKRPLDQPGLFLKLARSGLPGRLARLHPPLGKLPLGARIAYRRRM